MYFRATLWLLFATMVSAVNLAYASSQDNPSVNNDTSISKAPYYADWPKIASAVPKDAEIETFIANILSQMTLAEKVG